MTPRIVELMCSRALRADVDDVIVRGGRSVRRLGSEIRAAPLGGSSEPVPRATYRRSRVACEALAVGTIGTGANLWRVRVDLFALDDDGRRVGRAVDELRGLLQEDGRVGNADVGGDQGLGVTGRPVVG